MALAASEQGQVSAKGRVMDLHIEKKIYDLQCEKESRLVLNQDYYRVKRTLS